MVEKLVQGQRTWTARAKNNKLERCELIIYCCNLFGKSFGLKLYLLSLLLLVVCVQGGGGIHPFISQVSEIIWC